MSYYYDMNKYLKSIESIEENHCPICRSRLHFDNQKDSVYITCEENHSHFEIAGFRSLFNGNLALLYNNGLDKGIVDKTVLKEFESVIHRKIYSDKIK